MRAENEKKMEELRNLQGYDQSLMEQLQENPLYEMEPSCEDDKSEVEEDDDKEEDKES